MNNKTKKITITLFTAMTLFSCSGQTNQQNLNANHIMERMNNETYNVFEDYMPEKQFNIEQFRAKSKRKGYNREHDFVDADGIKVHQWMSVIVPGRKIYGFWEVKPDQYWETRKCPHSIYRFHSEYDVNGVLTKTHTSFYGNKFGIIRNYDSSGNVVSEEDLEVSYPFSIDNLIDKMKAEYDIDILDKQLVFIIDRRRSYMVDRRWGYYEVFIRDLTRTKPQMVKAYLIEGDTGNTVFVGEADARSVPSLKTYSIQYEYQKYLRSLKQADE